MTISRPCATYGCDEPRVVYPSQTATYCAKHLRERSQASKEKNREQAREYGRRYQKEYYAKNKEKYRAWREQTRPERIAYARAYYKRYYRYNTYGLNEDDYEKLLEAQGGVCAICGEDNGETLGVDHDHVTGRIRGLIHRKHNAAIGALGDSVDGLRRATAYLESPPATFLYEGAA